MSRALFDDGFTVRPWHGGVLLLTEALGGGRWLVRSGWLTIDRSDDIAGVLLIAHQLLSLTLTVSALVLAYLGREGDLVEPRRRFRGLFVGVSGVYILIVVATEIYFSAQAAPSALELVNLGMILVIVFAFGVAMLQLRPALVPTVAGGTLPVTDAPPADIDAPLLAALRRRMDEDAAYRRDGLTIGGLAEDLGTQEYRLRRLINGALGYRNFNAFLNDYRINEARRRLAEPAEARLPILTIAMDCGFASLGPFNRAFKQATGMTPSAFRRQHRNGPPSKS
jgi:AraC-like DNA-binding protein